MGWLRTAENENLGSPGLQSGEIHHPARSAGRFGCQIATPPIGKNRRRILALTSKNNENFG